MTTARDRGIDALRAVAILGVVFGHWLVTALVVDGDTVRVASPLRAVPWLAPASWLFQTLALFFFVGGLVATRRSAGGQRPAPDGGRRPAAAAGSRRTAGAGASWSAAAGDEGGSAAAPDADSRRAAGDGGPRPGMAGSQSAPDADGRHPAAVGEAGSAAAGDGRPRAGMAGSREEAGDGVRPGSHRAWLAARLQRLFRPVLVLVAVWSVVVIAATLWVYVEPGGVAAALRSHTVLKLVASPLWFLLVFAALTMAKPLVLRLHPAVPLAVVAAVDLGRFALGAPAWIGWINLAAGWLVPFCLGMAWSRGGFRSRSSAWAMLLGGLAATAILVRWFGYPVSMVGVPGQGISNLNPPTLAAVTFGVAQCGLALLVLPALRRIMLRARTWRAVSAVNRSAMTIFLWHQTSLLAVSLFVPGPLAGLHTAPTGASWLPARVMWLPVFALVLLGCWCLFHRHEHPHRHDGERLGAAATITGPRAASPEPEDAALTGARTP